MTDHAGVSKSITLSLDVLDQGESAPLTIDTRAIHLGLANGPGEFLPRGLSLEPATGIISGVPFTFFNEIATDSHFTLRVTDSNGQQTVIDYFIPVVG